ncbi:MAG TPA: biotin--[acetyl-CoA-carboxylase] ligase [Bacteroidales bacterium]|nr:biotin--[acetyl-CoA-carboxylase] ligase [Bacteroidales bacterium]
MKHEYFEKAVIYHLPEIQSTNDWLKLEYKSSKIAEGSAVRTEFQLAGRGQRTNVWESEKNKNLLCSVFLKPEFLSLDKQFYLSMAVSLAVHDVVSVFIPGVKVKWPNDIYVENKKLGGILIENSIMGSTYGSSIIGLGLNINQLQFSGAVPNPTSMSLITNNELDVKLIFSQFLAALFLRYKQLKSNDLCAIKSEYLSKLYQFNQWCKYEAAGKVFIARITEVHELGSLQVETQSGELQYFGFKEIVFLNQP